MSDNYTDADELLDDIEQDAEDQTPKGLRKAANRAKQLERELNELRRKVAFAEAGIATDDPKMSYFIKGYEGEMTAEAIRQAALEAGFLQTEQPQQTADPTMEADASAQQRVMSASAGAAYEGVTEEAALARLEAAMEEGGMEAMLDVARSFGIPTSIEQ